MRIRVSFYVALIVASALGLGAVVFAADPAVLPQSVTAIALMAVLAAVAEGLVYLLPISSTGSIAFIPYFACVLVAPTWLAPVAVTGVRILADVAAGRGRLKTVFNAAQHGLIITLGVFVFRNLGGISLLELRDGTLTQATVDIGGVAIASLAIMYLLGGFLVSGAIAIDKGMPLAQVWRTNQLATLWLDLLSLPLIFVFAWVYARFGAIAAAASWVPILGLRQVAKINLELERTNAELLELMVKSMEARDPYTSGHSRRVHHYSSIIARAMSLSEREVSITSRAALLHDVGKIHEKYGPILSKSDRLTPDEWAIIQSHPADGASLVSTMSKLKELVGPIRHHHENWDGTGYPDGLAGELIPLASRIIRFADTIDAMTTDRPYRRALTESQVRAEVVKCRGRQFDPAIADKLLSSQHWAQIFAANDPAAGKLIPPRLSLMGQGKAAS